MNNLSKNLMSKLGCSADTLVAIEVDMEPHPHRDHAGSIYAIVELSLDGTLTASAFLSDEEAAIALVDVDPNNEGSFTEDGYCWKGPAPYSDDIVAAMRAAAMAAYGIADTFRKLKKLGK